MLNKPNIHQNNDNGKEVDADEYLKSKRQKFVSEITLNAIRNRCKENLSSQKDHRKIRSMRMRDKILKMKNRNFERRFLNHQNILQITYRPNLETSLSNCILLSNRKSGRENYSNGRMRKLKNSNNFKLKNSQLWEISHANYKSIHCYY